MVTEFQFSPGLDYTRFRGNDEHESESATFRDWVTAFAGVTSVFFSVSSVSQWCPFAEGGPAVRFGASSSASGTAARETANPNRGDP
jgi:hypothetical protein